VHYPGCGTLPYTLPCSGGPEKTLIRRPKGPTYLGVKHAIPRGFANGAGGLEASFLLFLEDLGAWRPGGLSGGLFSWANPLCMAGLTERRPQDVKH